MKHDCGGKIIIDAIYVLFVFLLSLIKIFAPWFDLWCTDICTSKSTSSFLSSRDNTWPRWSDVLFLIFICIYTHTHLYRAHNLYLTITKQSTMWFLSDSFAVALIAIETFKTTRNPFAPRRFRMCYHFYKANFVWFCLGAEQ